MNTIYLNNPWSLEHHLTEITDEENDKLIEQSIYTDEVERPNLEKYNYNCNLPRTDETMKLKSLFFDLCAKYFLINDGHGNVKPITHLERTCDEHHDASCYVSTNVRYDNIWHAHLTRSTINAVYYAQVPDDYGTLSIMDVDGIEKRFPPLERYIYLIPGWMVHKPNPCKSSIPRVSVNMELFSTYRPVLNPANWTEEQYGFLNRKDGSFILW